MEPFLVEAPDCSCSYKKEAFWGYSLGVCPQCKSEHTNLEDGFQTLVGFSPFRDLDGKEHKHNDNHATKYGSCADCNFAWVEIYFAGDCWCGWPMNGKYTEKYPDNIEGKYGSIIGEVDDDGKLQLFTNPKWHGDKMPIAGVKMEIGMGVVNLRGVARAIIDKPDK